MSEHSQGVKMRKLLAACGLSSLVLAGCTASQSSQDEARRNVEGRGFTVTSVTSDPLLSDITVYVSFGEKGCVGRVLYDGDPKDMELVYEVAIPGSPSETQEVFVDDPTVAKLRSTSPFDKLCFGQSQPTPAPGQ